MTRKCEQKKCELRGTGQCPICKSCGSPPDIVSDYCEQCYCCEKEEGFIRGKPLKNNEIEITITQTEPTEVDKQTMKAIQEKIVEIIERGK